MARYEITEEEALAAWEQLDDIWALGLTRAELAAMLNVSEYAVYAWRKRRHRITPPTWPKLSMVHALATEVADRHGASFVRPFFLTHFKGLGGTPIGALQRGQQNTSRLWTAVRQFPRVIKSAGIKPEPIEPRRVEASGSPAGDQLMAAGFGVADLASIIGVRFTSQTAILRLIGQSAEAQAKLELAWATYEELTHEFSDDAVRVLLLWDLTKLKLDGSIAAFIGRWPADVEQRLRDVTDLLLSRQFKLHKLV
ncbi:MAG: hypothetical protein K0S68_1079 [Candidatus Saccharibacteria bacterium]|nr:hypothetical protein [Candidatus Saccharibacteria bacterium]